MKKLCSNCVFKLKVLAVLAIVGLLVMLFAIKRGATQEHWVRIAQKTFVVEIADTEALRTRGLSNRSRLDTDAGMLFVFPVTGKHGFWMKDMHFPIDIIWITHNQVTAVTTNLPLPTTADLPVYYPPQPVDRVLEIAAGEATRTGITIGDRVEFSQ